MRTFRLVVTIALGLAVFGVPAVHAASVESRIEVSGRGDSERASGAIRALFNVLRDLYPSEDELTPAQRREISGEANDFVQRYGYVTDTTGQIQLRLQFDEDAIRARVKSVAGDPSETPGLEAALLWLVVAQDTEDLLLTDGAQGVLPDTLDQIAAAIEQPLVYPRDDALSSGEVTTANVRDADAEILLPASSQYPAAQVVVLKMSADGDQWRGNWTLLGNGDQWTSNGSLADMLQVGLTAYQGRAAALTAVASPVSGYGTRQGEISLAVGGATSATDYAWLSNALRDRFPRATVRVAAIADGQMIFVLDEVNGVPAAAETLATIPQLQILLPSQSGLSGADRAADLNYLLVR